MKEFKHILWFDIETFSKISLKTHGLYRYAEHPSTEPILFAYALDECEVKLWDLTVSQTPPDDLFAWMNSYDVQKRAHNVMFDRVVLSEWSKRTQADTTFEIPIEDTFCTMCQALTHSLPGALHIVGKVLGLPTDFKKFENNRKLIRRFCEPASAARSTNRYDRYSHPGEWKTFCDYAMQDVVAMREISRRLPDFNYADRELELFHLDQLINDRGFLIDTELVEAATEIADIEKQYYIERIKEITDGEVKTPSSRQALMKYLNKTYGTKFDNTQASTFLTFIDENPTFDTTALEIMQISIDSNKSSVAKYTALGNATSEDKRFRGGLQFSGAARTRRWSGRTFQPQNLPSRGLPEPDEIEDFIAALKLDMHDQYGSEVVHYLSSALRGAVIAPEGKDLIVSDLANIEGRISAYICGEDWLVDAYRDFDAGRGEDIYKLTASRLTGTPAKDITKDIRQALGKIPALFLSYAGGVGAFNGGAKTYNFKVRDYWDDLNNSLDPKFFEKAEEHYLEWGKEKMPDMHEQDWIGSEAAKLAWRAEHPNIVNFWYKIERACVAAICDPLSEHKVGEHIKVTAYSYQEMNWLSILLPSGNMLMYFNPELTKDSKSFSYRGVDNRPNSKNQGAWIRINTYGGMLLENICQSLSRDILAYQMPAIEKEFDVLLTVHDEVVCETDRLWDGKGVDFVKLLLNQHLETPIPWLPDFPLVADGFRCKRYHK